MTSIPDIPSATSSYAYTAQTFEGQPVSGTIDAVNLDDASQRLMKLRLRVLRLDPANKPSREKPLSSEDFAAFNQQLAHLSAANLPIEQGLRLIAEDLRGGRMAQSIRQVADELDRGVPLAEAFQRHEKQFPLLYSSLVDAGVKSGNLSGVLLNLGRHLELVSRLRASVWRSAAYPLTVLAGLLVVLIFLSVFVLPKFQLIFRDFNTALPTVTLLLLSMVSYAPVFIAAALVLFLGLPLIWALLRALRLDRAAADLALPIPMIGPILRRNLIARWCDAMRVAVESGIDLPQAINMACDVVASPALAGDGARIISQLESGRPVDQLPKRLRILPKPVLSVIQLSIERSDLSQALGTMANMYEQQAEMRLFTVEASLTPALIIFVGFVIGIVVIGLFAPLVALIQSVSVFI